MASQTIIIIPARMASTRLPRKPLADIAGKTMIQRVYEQAKKAEIGEVFIACDGKEIADQVENFGGKTIVTDPNLPSGTDRIYAALQQIPNQERFSVVVNLQGDLPNIDPKAIRICAAGLESGNYEIATIATIITNISEISNPNIVKIAVAANKQALYFSRSAIPYSKNPKIGDEYYHHIGIYAYKKAALENFVKLKPSKLEIRESLEQLRALENGLRIKVEIVENQPISVDSPQDLQMARSYFGESCNAEA